MSLAEREQTMQTTVHKPKKYSIYYLDDEAITEGMLTHTHIYKCQGYWLEVETYKENPKYCC